MSLPAVLAWDSQARWRKLCEKLGHLKDVLRELEQGRWWWPVWGYSPQRATWAFLFSLGLVCPEDMTGYLVFRRKKFLATYSY